MSYINRYILNIMVLLVALPLTACQFNLVTDQSQGLIPQEVRDLEGTYVGSWTIFGIDEEGQVVKQASWTDTIQAENPQTDGDQAYVLTATEMVFDGGDIPPMEFEGREGYLLKSDGSLGDYFIETFGQISKLHQLSEDVWISITPASPQDLDSYRLPNVSSGQHVLNKVVTSDDGMETHRITRLTTVEWTDQAGQGRSTQFVSLQGFHQRQSQ